jgi:hypothetical protein
MNSYKLNGKLPANLFELDAFKNGDRVERIYMHLIDPHRYQLKPNEEKYLTMVQQAFSIIVDNPSRHEARRIILDKVVKPITDSRRGNRNYISGIQLIRDAENIFGRFEDINKRLQRGIMRDRITLRLTKLYEKAEEGEEVDKFIAKYEEVLMKLDRLDEIIDLETVDTTIPELNLTMDPSALLDAEEIDYESCDEEE